MSNFSLPYMDGRTGVATNANPLTFTGTIQAQEMSICYVVIDVSAVSAGISALAPAVVKFQTTFDDGANWADIVGVTIENITGTGKFFSYFTSGVVKIAPQVRVTVTPPAGQTVTIKSVKKSRVTEFAQFRAPVSGGGGAGEDTASVLGNAQMTVAGNLTAAASLAYVMGWDGTQHRELAVTPTGDLNITLGATSQCLPLRHRYAIANVTTAAWTEITAATGFVIKDWSVFDSSGQTMYLGKGAAGAEVVIAIIPPGGMPNFSLSVDVGTRLSVKAVSGNATAGELVINGRG